MGPPDEGADGVVKTALAVLGAVSGSERRAHGNVRYSVLGINVLSGGVFTGVCKLTGVTPVNTPVKSPKTIAAERELDGLQAIATNGWLTTRHLGLWVYRDSTEHVASNKASLLLKRLAYKKEVKKCDTCNGIAAWILTKRGAGRLNEILEARGANPYAHHGHDIGFLDWSRTITTVEHLVKQIRDKSKLVVGAVGRAGIRSGEGGKQYADCDGFYFLDDSFFKDSYTVIGVLGITNAREGVQSKLRRLLAQNIKIDLAGDPRLVATLRERVKR